MVEINTPQSIAIANSIQVLAREIIERSPLTIEAAAIELAALLLRSFDEVVGGLVRDAAAESKRYLSTRLHHAEADVAQVKHDMRTIRVTARDRLSPQRVHEIVRAEVAAALHERRREVAAIKPRRVQRRRA